MTITLNDRNPRRAALRTRLAGWLRGPTFRRDIVIVLAIKFALLMVLKYTFFNHPQAENMSLPPEQVAQALLSVPASHPSQGDQHAR
ncbi:putative membrane protein [Paraburkholderia xenovorans LB400]|uniref:Membrane protein n=1 Tax=Paraburkholderia xenovorans (strain LB400) TaxID=266265 RepID=Q13XY3_PARXL|nr:cytochrome oxidase putative small subunit CydP [Paraburkholderia xenovorans]ABE31056.1 Putative membrane protein [Paraburkholderia xenovorans LB400]AIP30731.1 putative membrane protein [Paraburkholderia xenovorans LB400]